MFFRNVALISLALVAAASAAETSPTSDHVSSLLSQRRLPKEEDAKAKKEKDNKNKNNKNNKNNNVVIPMDQLQINQQLDLLAQNNGALGQPNPARPVVESIIEPNRESDDVSEMESTDGAGDIAEDTEVPDDTTGMDEENGTEEGSMGDMGGDEEETEEETEEESAATGPTAGAGVTGGEAASNNPGQASLTGCSGAVESLLAKGESWMTTDKRCKKNCDCMDGCCVKSGWGFGFCTPRSDAKPFMSAYGGGFLVCEDSTAQPNQ